MPKTAREIPIKEVLETVYPKLNLKKAGEYFGVGQTTMHKWLAYRGIERTKRQRVKRSEEWKKNKSEQMKGKSFRKKTGVEKNCVFCKQKIYVIPARLGSQKFCSNHCKSLAQRVPEKSKVCENPDCQLSFNRGNKTAQNFKRQKYCSKSCQTLMSPPPKFAGEQHPLWKGEKARRRNRLGPLESWRKKVLSRDKATCQICSQDDVKLVVHHIKPFETFPELRFDVKNGLTLCEPCHWKIHGYNLHKSGIVESHDERGILKRRWTGTCLNCNKFIVKTASDMRRVDGTYRNYGFCSKNCALILGGRLRKGKPKGAKTKDLFEALANSK